MEESSTGDYVILKSFDESEFTEDLIQNYVNILINNKRLISI